MATDKKLTADQLPEEQKRALRNILRHKIADKLINDILANPPEVNLADIEVVLPKGQAMEHFDVTKHSWKVSGECETCSAIGGGCETCSAIGGGCETCSAIGGGCETCSGV